MRPAAVLLLAGSGLAVVGFAAFALAGPERVELPEVPRPRIPVSPAPAAPPRPSPPPAPPRGGTTGREILATWEGRDRDACVMEALADKLIRVPRLVALDLGNGLEVDVTADALAVGASDPVRFSASQRTHQRLADGLGFLPLTARLSRALDAAAVRRASPRPIAPPPARLPPRPRPPEHAPMESIERLLAYVERVERVAGPWTESGALLSTVGKDYLTDRRLIGRAERCCIGGWWVNGAPIQPVSTLHELEYQDYSHALRYVSRRARLRGAPVDLATIYTGPQCTLVTDDGLPVPARHPGVS